MIINDNDNDNDNDDDNDNDNDEARHSITLELFQPRIVTSTIVGVGVGRREER